MVELLQSKCRLLKLLLTAVGIMAASAVSWAQTPVAVSGKVVDRDGVPVIGATVLDAHNPTRGTTTTVDGTFTIQMEPEGTLSVSYLGYTPVEVALGGRTQIVLTLEQDTQVIDDVVVIGYGTARKSDLTGAIASVGGAVLSDKPVNSLGQALQGRASGVMIVDNGNPHQNVTLKIRGLGTINDSDPLYVIDGVPSSLGLNSINVSDIESVNILKDASAAAIYGSQGANGVVLITTKRGRTGEGVLSFSMNVGVSQATNIPGFLDASQYAALNNEILSAGGEQTNPDWANPASLGKGTDWIDLMFRTALRQNYNVSWSGGTEKSRYYVSGGYTSEDGIVKSVGYKRLTFQFNGEYQVKPWLKTGNNITFSGDKKTNGSYNLTDVFNSLPTQRVYREDGTFDGPSDNTLWHGGIRNQLGTATIESNKIQGYNVLGSVFAEASIIKGLKFRTLASVEAKMAFTTNFWPKYDWKPIEVPTSTLFKKTDKTITYLWDNYFTYDRSFGDHYVNAMAGTSINWGVNDWMDGSKYGFLKDNVNQLTNGTTISGLNGSGSEWAIASFMVRGNYVYLNRYMITGTVRRDGSSRFGKANRWGTFPSVSGAWKISEEGFFRDVRGVSSLKLRAGYGVTGHQKFGNYTFFSAYNTGVYSFNGSVVSTLVPHMLPNPNVYWEEVHQTNVGIDAGFLGDRLRLTVDLYNKETKGMLVPMAVPASTGYSDKDVPYINAGQVNNKGIEVSISADVLRGQEFTWDADFNISFNKNKIKSLNSDTPIYSNSIENQGNVLIQAEGHAINSFYGYVAAGLFQNAAQVNAWATQVAGGTAPGDIRFLDLDNNGVINDADRTFIGNPNPMFTFGFNNSLRYKGFDLGIFIQGVYGNDIFNANRIYQESMAGAQNQYKTVLGRWTGEGTSSSMPRAVLSDPNKNTRISSRFVEDGSYLRLKNVTLGYTLPQKYAQKARLGSLRLYLSCQNLLTWTSYSGFDPEVGLNGVDLGVYPVTRTFSLGLDISF